MKLFKKKRNPAAEVQIVSAQRGVSALQTLPNAVEPFEKALYDRLRFAVPVIDAALTKIIRLTGGFRVVCDDEDMQAELDSFLENVPVGLTGRSIGCFADNFLDSMLTYGSAVGEIAVDSVNQRIAGLWNADVCAVRVGAGTAPFERKYTLISPNGNSRTIPHPERIVYAELTGGHSLLRGLPSLSGILLRIYQCIDQNYERAGNVRYAVTYKPDSDLGDMMYTRERAQQIAREWADGMNSAKYGQVKDFIAVGDVDIKVIGADMSSQQADILTSELEYFRRLLSPVICEIGNAYLCSVGSDAVCRVEWDNINLQDESALAEARLKNAQAREIELRLAEKYNDQTEVNYV